MFSPRVLPKKILDFDTDGHFLQIRNISIENLKKLLEIFQFGPNLENMNSELAEDIMKESGGKNLNEVNKEKIIAYRESIIKAPAKEKDMGDINALKDLSVDTLKEGEIYEGVVNNVNGKNIYVYLTPTIIGLIK
jgi:hypothetical protein